MRGPTQRRTPYGGNHAANWPSLLAAVAGYLLSATVSYLVVVRHPGASLQLSWPGATMLACAAPLILSTLWLISRAHGMAARLTVFLCMAMGFLADSLVLSGLHLLYRLSPSPLLHGLLAVYGFLTTAALVFLSVSTNRTGLDHQQREQSAGERDALTGLLNRRGLQRAYEALRGQPVTVVMLDMNDLKAVNDHGGHGAGDRYLHGAAQQFGLHLPSGAQAGRWGGDEFVLLLPPGTAGPLPGEAELPVRDGQVEVLIRSLLTAITHPQGHRPAFAWGAVTVQGLPLGQAIALADQRMYEHKGHSGLFAAAGEQGLGGVQTYAQFLQGLTQPEQVLREGLSRALDLTGFGGGAYYEQRQVDDPHLTPISWTGPHTFSADQSPLPQLHTQGLMGEAFTQNQTRWSADYAQSGGHRPEWAAFGVRSAIAAPVCVEGRVTGVLSLASFTDWRAVGAHNRLVIETLALHLGHVLERQRVTARLSASLENSIRELVTVMEVRDLETAGHTERVKRLVLTFGQALGLNAEQLDLLRLGAYLHDVGKLSLPDRVLLKPGRLDAQERALVETHTVRGMELVQRLPSLPAEVVAVVLSHHERWDGQGYPHRLAGEAIPLLARVFALCDVYDALTSERPYKQAWTHQAALEELRAQKAGQFDPHLTDQFLRIFGARPASHSPESAQPPESLAEPRVVH